MQYYLQVTNANTCQRLKKSIDHVLHDDFGEYRSSDPQARDVGVFVR